MQQAVAFEGGVSMRARGVRARAVAPRYNPCVSLAAFIASLAHGPRLQVAPPPSPLPGEGEAARRAIRALDATRRAAAPEGVPPLDEPTALWAALALYRAAQALAFPELPDAFIEEALRAPPPPAPTQAARAWSADLALSALPDLLALARAARPGDALCRSLEALALAHPLSSPGAFHDGPLPEGGPDPDQEAAILADDALAVLYADRVIERSDLRRLGGARRAAPRLRERVAAALGAFPDLAPEVAAALGGRP